MKKRKIFSLSILLALFCALLVLAVACGKTSLSAPSVFDIDEDNLLTWNTVENARRYKIEVLAADSETVVKEAEIRRTSYSLSGLEEGDYDIRVKSLGSTRTNEESEWSEILNFHKNYETGALYRLVNSRSEYEIYRSGMAEGEIVIEDVYRGRPLTQIADGAFKSNRRLTKVTIGNNVRYIGSNAFYNCSLLTEIVVPQSVTTIAESAFSSCRALTSVNIPENITEIKDYTFSYCTALTSIEIPARVTSIGASAFSSCLALESVTIPDSVVIIGESAFSGASALKEVELGTGVVWIGNSAFLNCAALETCNFEQAVKLKRLDESAFADCTSLKTVTLPDGLENIGIRAFNGAAALEAISIPESVTHVGAFAFMGTKFYDDAVAENQAFIYADKWLVNCHPDLVKDEYAGLKVLFEKNSTLDESYLRSDIFGIADQTFYKAKGFRAFTAPESLKVIGQFAFAECTELGRAVVRRVELVDDSAFAGCSTMSFIQFFPEGLTRIGHYAFMNCTQLATVFTGLGGDGNRTADRFPTTLTSVGAMAFYDTALYNSSNLASGIVYVDNWVVGVKNVRGEVDFSADRRTVRGICDYAFESCSYLTGILGMTNVWYLGTGAFYGCRSLELANIPNVEEIGAFTFYHCSSLTEVDVSNNLKSIGRSAFSGCEMLQKLNYNGRDSLKTIGTKAFFGCTLLQRPYFGEGLETIGDYAFYKCLLLREIKIPDSVVSIGNRAFSKSTFLRELDLGNGVRHIGDRAFSSCGSLTSIVIPDSVKTIGEKAFYDCAAVTELSLGNGVEEIGAYAFKGLENVTTLTLPASLKLVNKYAFKGLTSLKTVYIEDGVEDIDPHAFNGCKDAVVYLQAESVPENWNVRWNSSFCPVVTGAVLSEDGTYIASVTASEGFVLNVREEEELPAPYRAGYEFVGWATDAAATEAEYSAEALVSLPAGTTVYSIWREAPEPEPTPDPEPEPTPEPEPEQTERAPQG